MALRATAKQVKVYQMRLDGEPPDLAESETKRRQLEAAYQALFFQEVRRLTAKYPVLKYVFATLNGVFLPPQHKSKMKEQGLCQGPLDVWLILQRGEYGGWVMDMKVPGEYPTIEQKEWARHLAANGILSGFCYGAVEMWRCLCCYVGITGPDHFAADLARQEETVRILAGY